jgi:HEAT repeat protein
VLEEQTELLGDPDAAVRYWAAVGLQASERSSEESREALTTALADDSAVVRIAAAAALASHGRDEAADEAESEAADEPKPETPTEVEAALSVLQKELRSDDLDAVLLACRAIELLGEKARPAARAMRRAAARFEDAEGDQALFIRFSTGAFRRRRGR